MALGQRDTRAGETILAQVKRFSGRRSLPGHARRGQSGRPETRGGGDRPGRSEKRCRCLSQVARSAEAGVRVLLNRVANESRGSSRCPPSLGRRDWGGSARRGSPIVSVVTRRYRHRRCSQGGGGDVGCCGRAASSRGRGWGEVTHLEVSPPRLRDSPRYPPAPWRGTLPAPCPPSPPASRTARAPAFASVLPLLAHVCPPPMPIFLLGFWCFRINFRSLCMLRKLSLCRGLCYEQVLFPVRSFLV